MNTETETKAAFSIDDIEIIELEDRLELDIGRCNISCNEAPAVAGDQNG